MEFFKKKHIISSNNHRNIISLKKLIFPPISEIKVPQLLIDDESIKYITFSSSAQEIINIIMNNLIDLIPSITKNLDKIMKQLVITEMTAGVGGNVLNFAKYFKYVNAIEIDKNRVDFLEKNIKLYGYENVNCYNDNSLKLLLEKDDIVQDIVFFDPPWGGSEYKFYSKLRLKFGTDTIENICLKLLERITTKMIVIKLPLNYDFDYLKIELNKYLIGKYTLERMAIVVVKKIIS